MFHSDFFHNRLILTLLIGIPQFMACSYRTEKEQISVLSYDITNGIERDGKVYLSEIANDIETVKLETNDSMLIGSIYDIKISGNYLLLRDNLNQVLLFDTAGKFLREIGHKGNGPGEYLTTTGILVNEIINRIYIWDGGRNYILEYELNSGAFLKDHKLLLLSNKVNNRLCIIFCQ